MQSFHTFALEFFAQRGYTSPLQFDQSLALADAIEELELAPTDITQRALGDDEARVHLLFQFTTDQLKSQNALFATQPNRDLYDAFVFVALDLREGSYSRSDLATLARQFNQPFKSPVIVLFRHGQTLSLASVARRLNKTDADKHVLQKVSMLKDIARDADAIHPAHRQILNELAGAKTEARNWEDFHAKWNAVLDISELNRKFYRELSDWYFWAAQHVEFPRPQSDKRSLEEHRAMSVIRLITRLIFVWFIKERDLVPDELFQQREVEQLLGALEPDDSTYYKAILQNLFFATLNTDGKRQWREQDNDKGFGDKNYNTHTLWRYKAAFQKPDAAAALFNRVPFLNGGLFRCLDGDAATPDGKKIVERYDGFSERADNPLRVPNFLFWGDTQIADLNEAYGTQNRDTRVRPLLSILRSYKFTVTENTPLEEEVALDPELLGKVFENLLASYNPETSSTARKQTGSFYTPRPIVDYLVEESLFSHLQTRAPKVAADTIRALLSPDVAAAPALSDAEKDDLIRAIHGARILDPACGSGAFVMGALDALVRLLRKIDPHNARWKAQENRSIEAINFPEARDAARARFEKAFAHDEGDYARKLYLLERCIHGVDIQPIAVQIAKLRVFIALAVEQNIDRDNPDNMGIESLPNLETKIVAANTLRALEKPINQDIFTIEIQEKLRGKVLEYFTCFARARKLKLEAEIESLFNELGDYLESTDKSNATDAAKLRSWRFYDQNASAPFFDPEWMFGAHVKDGFDIIIGNPPFVRHEGIADLKPFLTGYSAYAGTADLYVYFFERGVRLLCEGGVLAFICSNKWIRAAYGKNLRGFLAQQTHVRAIVDFGELPIFTAATFPALVIAKRQSEKAATHFSQVKNLELPYPDLRALTEKIGAPLPLSAIKGDDWKLSNLETGALLEKMRGAGVPLGEYVNGQIFRGVLTGFNEAFILNDAARLNLVKASAKSAELIKPMVKGDDVRKWKLRDKGRWMIVTPIGVDIQSYPAIFAHLEQWQPQLEKRADQGKFWWELRACAYYDAFAKPKIIYPEIAKESRFAFDTTGIYPLKTVFSIPVDNKFLLGVLNSSAAWSFLKSVCSVLGDENKGGRLLQSTIFVSQIPIPAATPDEQNAIATRVESILAAKAGAEGDAVAGVVARLEGEIDDLVFALYGLTDDEIALVNGA